MVFVGQIPTNKEVYEFIAERLPCKTRFTKGFYLVYDAEYGGHYTDGTAYTPLFRGDDQLVVDVCKRFIGEWQAVKRLEIKLDPKEKGLPIFKVEMYAFVHTDDIITRLNRDEIKAIIAWSGVVENEFNLTEEDEKIINKLRESLK